MNLKDLINPDRIILLTEDRKKEVLLEIIDNISHTYPIKDIADLTKKIFYREELMSTGIGLGIAIPHIRFEEINEPVITIGVHSSGLKDYQSIDDLPIKIIIMILVGKNQHKEHIKILSKIVSKLKTDNTIEKIVNSKNRENIYKSLTE